MVSNAPRPRRRQWLIAITLLALAAVAVVLSLRSRAIRAVRHSAILSNLHLHSGGANEFRLAHWPRMFVTYDEVVGPIIPPPSPVLGEDYRQLYPARYDHTEFNVYGPFLLPDGTELPGLQPRPTHPDGIQVGGETTGERWETTWDGGRIHGPFRAYRRDGTIWSEARYENGRVVEAWLITRAGQRFNELTNGPAGAAALAAEDPAR